MKTGREVVHDLMLLLRESDIYKALAGDGRGIYLAGKRPRNSREEDIVVNYLTGTTGIPQRGTVNILVYIPDIAAEDGTLTEDAHRTTEVEALAAEWVRSIKLALGYDWRLDAAITTEDDAEINQHFILIKLNYKYL